MCGPKYCSMRITEDIRKLAAEGARLEVLADTVGSVGVVAGVGINAAHELGHKSEKIEQWLAKVALAQSLYGHFYVEHNFGHHVRVATPQDPASSRFGESFWRFLPRSVFGGLRSAWRIESARLQRKGKRTWSFENNILNAWAMSVVLFATLIGIFGWEVAPWLLLQAVAGFTFLEAANYLEHYGLLRGKRLTENHAILAHQRYRRFVAACFYA